MGSLTSRPKAPSVPKTVYVEVPARSSDTGDDASSQTTQDGAQDDAQDTSSEARTGFDGRAGGIACAVAGRSR